MLKINYFSMSVVTAILSYSLFSTVPAMATVVIGDGADGINCAPFGCVSNNKPSTRYQQVYASTGFSGPLSIAGVAFYNDIDGGSLNSGDYALRLSITPAAVDALSSSFDDNFGADSALLVFTGQLPSTEWGGSFTLNFTSAFSYDPSLGNLLLDIQYDGTANPDPISQVAYNGNAGGIFSRMYNFGSGFEGYGLKTGFETGPLGSGAVPEPTIWAMMIAGFGMVGGALRRRTMRAKVSFV
jgi:hypothetical protein